MDHVWTHETPTTIELLDQNTCTAVQVLNHAVQFTTPLLNRMPIPPNTTDGRRELAKRVDLKLNAMMSVAEYMLHPRWHVILKMCASDMYNAQRTAWMLMKGLEIETMRRNKQLDAHGLPILQDKSKYKMIVVAYCRQMWPRWKRPIEHIKLLCTGEYHATVRFGPVGHEQTRNAKGTQPQNALYDAYIDLMQMIPKHSAMSLMVKLQLIPGYKTRTLDLECTKGVYMESTDSLHSSVESDESFDLSL
eukprot:427529_1